MSLFAKTVRVSLFVGAITLLSLLVLPVSAQISTVDPQDSKLIGGSDLGAALFKVINYFLGIVGLVAVIVLIYAGVRYITSLGDEKKAEDAKRVILYAVIGLIVIGLSAVVVNFVLTALIGRP